MNTFQGSIHLEKFGVQRASLVHAGGQRDLAKIVQYKNIPISRAFVDS